MQKTVPSTLSADGVLHLSCPRSWREMTQEQLRYALHVIGCGLYSSVEARTLMLLRFTGIKVVRHTLDGWLCTVPSVFPDGKKKRHTFLLQSWQVQDFIGQLEYIDSYETMDVRLESIQGFKAVDALLHGVRFYDYLQMEKYYQGFLATRELKYIIGLARLLYPTAVPSVSPTVVPDAHPSGLSSLNDVEQTGTMMWYAYVKKQFCRFFPHLFKPAPVQDGKPVNWVEQMNIQVRALTGGDITKEQAVYDKDCWRALTELDAKAREAEDIRRSMANRKS